MRAAGIVRGRGWRCVCLLVFALALLFESAPAASSRPLGLVADLATATSTPAPAPASTGTAWTAAASTATARPAAGGISYEGGPVVHSNRTHLIFWQPSNHPELQFDTGYISLVERFLSDVARASHSTANVYGITGQYRDPAGPAAYASSYGGAIIDTDPTPVDGCVEPLPPRGPGWLTCLTDSQLQTELAHVVATRGLPTGHNEIYFLVTPKGFGDCAGSGSCSLGGSPKGYCGYHSVTARGLLYAVIPYNAVPGHCQSTNPRPNAGTADPALSTISHEQAETVTDPLGDGWLTANQTEIGDLCLAAYGKPQGGSGGLRWNETIAGHHYWLQELFSRITGACASRPKPDSVSVTLPTRVVARSAVTLVARASQPGGRIIAYNWNFGDGHGGRRRRPVHTYAKAGSYRLYLRITDSAGNWAYATRRVVVRRR